MMAGNDVGLDTPEKRQQVAMLALKDEELLEHIVELLCGKSRLKRQKAASIVAIISNEDATVLLPYAEDICEALNHPEAQTRWEVLHTLDQMGKVGQRYDENTLALAEDALYDENNGIQVLVRLRLGEPRELQRGLAAHRRDHPVLPWQRRVLRHAHAPC